MNRFDYDLLFSPFLFTVGTDLELCPVSKIDPAINPAIGQWCISYKGFLSQSRS